MRAAEDVVWAPVEGEIVLFSASDGRYYGLDEVAARIWNLLNEGLSPADVVQALLAEFEVEETVAQAEVERLLRELTDLRLIVKD